MQPVKRLFILLAVGAGLGVVMACESPTLPPIPPEEKDPDPNDPDDGGEETGFILLRDAPILV